MNQDYAGFEQGPIRPPSEAGSLLLRVTRNCPWNRCKFCPVYKGARFSRRPTEHVLQDLDAVHRALEAMARAGSAGASLRTLPSGPVPLDLAAAQAARHWLIHGARHVFLQDADSLIISTAEILAILGHLKARFPRVDRITSYARSRTIARLQPGVLPALRQAGLTRLHLGLESGSDEVLKRMAKGVSRAQQILAGRRVKEAGIELSEYYMPGLGGQDLWEVHAVETATALNAINPDFIRLRALAVPHHTPLYEDWRAGSFLKGSDVLVARELELFLLNLQGITSRVVSDHILNLLPEVEGTLPRDRERMLRAVRRFLSLDDEARRLYQVGRRLGLFSGLQDLKDPDLANRAREVCRQNGIGPDNVDQVCDDLMRRYI